MQNPESESAEEVRKEIIANTLKVISSYEVKKIPGFTLPSIIYGECRAAGLGPEDAQREKEEILKYFEKEGIARPYYIGLKGETCDGWELPKFGGNWRNR